MLYAAIKNVVEMTPVGVNSAEIRFFSLGREYSKTVENLGTAPFCVGITSEEQDACMRMMTELDEDAERA